MTIRRKELNTDRLTPVLLVNHNKIGAIIGTIKDLYVVTIGVILEGKEIFFYCNRNELIPIEKGIII